MIYKLKNTDYKDLLPSRFSCSHKGTFGTLGAVVGSTSYQGAATLSTKAALYGGVGLVCSFIPDSIYIPYASKINGAVIEPMKSENGMINDASLLKRIKARRCTAILFGCGIGISNGSTQALSQVLSTDLPVIVDADGITALSENIYLLEREPATILTPHLGEFSRLISHSVDEIKSDLIYYATQFVERHNCILVLKSDSTIIATPDKVFAITAPTSSLSKGGSGDVLAGLIASFVAQGISPVDASVCAVTLHNRSGHIASEHFGEYSTQPDDLIDIIHKLLSFKD